MPLPCLPEMGNPQAGMGLHASAARASAFRAAQPKGNVVRGGVVRQVLRHGERKYGAVIAKSAGYAEREADLQQHNWNFPSGRL
jgi:hypothetical protein